MMKRIINIVLLELSIVIYQSPERIAGRSLLPINSTAE